MRLTGGEQLAESGAATVERTLLWANTNGPALLIYVAVTAGIYLLLVALRAVVRRIAGKPENLEAHSWREILARMAQKTRSFFLVAIAAEVVTISVDAPPRLDVIVGSLMSAALVVQGAIWMREFILAVIARRASAEGSDQSTLSSAMGVIRLIVNVAVWAIAAILILDNIGVNVTALVAGLGIGGIAIGLAAQGIFSDLFAALSILFDKPFKRGDTISVDDLTGSVEAIGLKTTRIRALSGEQVIVSNTKLLDSKIRNLTLFHRRRVVLGFGVIYQTPGDVLASLPGVLEAIIAAQPNATFDRAHVIALAPSSIDIEVVFHVESTELEVMMEARHTIVIAVVRRFAELGIMFAYPTQTTFTSAPDGTMVMPYANART